MSLSSLVSSHGLTLNLHDEPHHRHSHLTALRLGQDRQNIFKAKQADDENSNMARTLSHRPSVLDLIDETKLTSLPLPPPLKPKSRSRAPSPKRSLKSCAMECNDCDRMGLSDARVEQSSFVEEISFIDDSQFEEGDTEDPIVLIEDYLNEAPDNEMYPQTLKKKQSLAIFKQKANYSGGDNEVRTLSTSPEMTKMLDEDEITSIDEYDDLKNRHRASSGDTVCNKPSQEKTENLIQLFGDIPGMNSLKHCDLCEKPLYEISSVINEEITSHKDTNISKTFALLDGTKRAKQYKEFVCWECREPYEDFFNDFYLAEQKSLGGRNTIASENGNNDIGDKDNINKKLRLWEIFRGIQMKYCDMRESKSSLSFVAHGMKPTLSDCLLNQLHSIKTKYNLNSPTR